MHLLISLLLNALALIVTANLVPGFKVVGFEGAILAAIVLGVMNTFIKPILGFLTLPINLITLGLFTFVLNAIILRLVDSVVPNFSIDGWFAAILGAVVLSVVSTVLSHLAKDLVKK